MSTHNDVHIASFAFCARDNCIKVQTKIRNVITVVIIIAIAVILASVNQQDKLFGP